MRITESLQIENGTGGYQEACSDYEAYGLKKHGLTRSHYKQIVGVSQYGGAITDSPTQEEVPSPLGLIPAAPHLTPEPNNSNICYF